MSKSIAETIAAVEALDNAKAIEPVMTAGDIFEDFMPSFGRKSREAVYKWNELTAPVKMPDGREKATYFFVSPKDNEDQEALYKRMTGAVNNRNAENKKASKVERYRATRSDGPNGIKGVRVWRIA